MFLMMEPAGVSRGKWRHQLLLKDEMIYTVVYELINAYKNTYPYYQLSFTILQINQMPWLSSCCVWQHFVMFILLVLIQ